MDGIHNLGSANFASAQTLLALNIGFVCTIFLDEV